MKLNLGPNATGWGLLIIGLATMGYAHHVSFDKLETVGGGFITAALYALQTKPHALDAPATPKGDS